MDWEVLASVALKAVASKEDMVDMVDTAPLRAWVEVCTEAVANGNLVVECTMVAPGPEVAESEVGTDLDLEVGTDLDLDLALALALADHTEECKQSFTKSLELNVSDAENT